MYGLSELRMALNDPGVAISELNRLYHQRLGMREYNPDGIDIFSEDWDNLIILDACRYDSFADWAELLGRLKKRTSRASATREFIESNFRDIQDEQTVYVSSNQWYPRLKEDINAEIFKFVSTEQDAAEGLVSKPETVTQTALDMASNYPNKRQIVHYMQPHQPFLGPTGEKFKIRDSTRVAMQASDTNRSDFIKAYHENLDLVLSEVEKLIEQLSGKTVVTADHGELLGHREWPLPQRTYGHPIGVYLPGLVTVPWHVYQNGDRKTIQADTPEPNVQEVEEGDLNDHLRDLGYLV